ncbi:hypothetical protein M885DRAFT_16050 [Pelagophyceae sp. CCMP2097]|nr:hypothetical protein M885DRAFT_16050 [Pelagophyceae sp. CCMP2097]
MQVQNRRSKGPSFGSTRRLSRVGAPSFALGRPPRLCALPFCPRSGGFQKLFRNFSETFQKLFRNMLPSDAGPRRHSLAHPEQPSYSAVRNTWRTADVSRVGLRRGRQRAAARLKTRACKRCCFKTTPPPRGSSASLGSFAWAASHQAPFWRGVERTRVCAPCALRTENPPEKPTSCRSPRRRASTSAAPGGRAPALDASRGSFSVVRLCFCGSRRQNRRFSGFEFDAFYGLRSRSTYCTPVHAPGVPTATSVDWSAAWSAARLVKSRMSIRTSLPTRYVTNRCLLKRPSHDRRAPPQAGRSIRRCADWDPLARPLSRASR